MYNLTFILHCIEWNNRDYKIKGFFVLSKTFDEHSTEMRIKKNLYFDIYTLYNTVKDLLEVTVSVYSQ